MDRVREQFEDMEEMLRAAFDGLRKDLHTNMPVIVDKDSDGHTVTVRPALKGEIRKPDGSIEYVDLPIMAEIPVHFPQGGGLTLSFPVKKGMEGFVPISSRGFDNWLQSGGVQKAAGRRMHHLTDGLAFLPLRSDPNRLKNVSADSAQIRTDDGKLTIDHSKAGTKIKAVDPSDQSADPFKSATVYHETSIHPTGGISHKAVSGETTHEATVSHSGGATLKSDNGQHVVEAKPGVGVSIVSAIKVALAAPAAAFGFGAVSGLFGAAGGGRLGDIAASAGGLAPAGAPLVVRMTKWENFAALPNCADDAAAALAGVEVDGPYRDGSKLCFRVA